MKQEIAKNDYYEFYVDKGRNRFYSKLKGFWQKASEVPDYLDDLKKTLEPLSPGFTILNDTRDYKTPTSEVMELHGKLFQMLIDAKMGKLALVVDQLVVGFAGRRAAREAGAEEMTKQFDDIKEAEDWLDGKDV